MQKNQVRVSEKQIQSHEHQKLKEQFKELVMNEERIKDERKR